ncbi:hypothetical protein N658DRAFT_89656 [Parathielavia hyrcaniae]|uniref:Uncharacterized protein n=1 Tax=Parathielavia hyrcaniae TaxID=113614 RepID=A0AAN6PRS9_9PEZI|nr:hypothetical protein N658DRAFT_89656 [Parathielavia hyrcaniae]
MLYIDVLLDRELVPANLPPVPFSVFGPVRTMQEVSNIGVGALEGELQRCRFAIDNPLIKERGQAQVMILAGTLRGAFGVLKEVARRVKKLDRQATRQAKGEDTREAAVGDAEENDNDDDEVLGAPLNTLAQIEAFVGDPGNSRIVSIAAVYLHLNRFKACRSPGTIGFLENVQEMTMFEESWLIPWVPSTSHGVRFFDNGYCGAVPSNHPTFNARALLIAFNFCYVDILKMVPANIDDCSRWTESPQLVKKRNKTLHDLIASGRQALVTELIRCRFRVER